MVEVKGTAITISREDTAELTITMTGDVPEDGTIALVTMKRKASDKTYLWQRGIAVQNGQIVLRLNSGDTDHPAGKYVWDIRLSYGDGTVFTPFAPAPFVIVDTVGELNDA